MTSEDGTVSWAELLTETKLRLERGEVDDADISARRIIEEASGHSGSEFHLGMSDLATERGVAALDRMVADRLRGRPLQYVVGSWGFRHLDLLVDERVLIPRPETEHVVEVALAEFDARPGNRVLDLGTGSGAIGLSVLTERPHAEVVLTDRSSAALQVARANLAGVGRAATRATLLEGSWFEALEAEHDGAFTLIISNPPYVAPDDPLPAVVAEWEPTDALIAADGGFSDIATLIADASRYLTSDGLAAARGRGRDQDDEARAGRLGRDPRARRER